MTTDETKRLDMSPEQLAVIFHNIYERLAPNFGYETRKETRDFNATTSNGRLMIAVCDEILKYHLPQSADTKRLAKIPPAVPMMAREAVAKGIAAYQQSADTKRLDWVLANWAKLRLTFHLSRETIDAAMK